MTFNTLDAAIITAVFLVPGFICSAVLSMLIARRSKTTEVRVVEFLTFSSINLGIWLWFVVLMLQEGFLRSHPVWTALGLIVVLMVSPVGLAVVLGWLANRQWPRWFLGRLGFKTIQRTPTAWDWHFSQGRPYWVVVTRKDGSRVFGFFGVESFAGDDPATRDLYLEAEFRPTDSGDWAPVEESGGGWIAANEIAVIEFRKVTEINYGQEED